MAVDHNAPSGDANQTQAMIDAFKSGQVNLGGTPTTEESTSESVSEQEESVVEKFNSWGEDSASEETEGQEQELSEDQADSTDSEEDLAAAEESSDIKELVVKGPNGRKKKLKIDYSDRDKIDRAFRLAYEGRAVWQKERDEARSELSSVKEERDSLKTDWDKLESAYETGGIKGLVNLLEKNDSAYDKFLEQEMTRTQRFQDMTEDERAVYEKEQAIEQERARSEKLREEYEQKLKQIQEEQDKATTRSLESKIHPSFDRYRFRGTLGDEVAETEFDEMLWNRALSSLEKIADEDVELTSAMIDKEFRRVSQTIKKHLSTQVDNKLKKTISKKKQDAAKKVRATVSKSMKSSQDLEDFRTNMKSGNIVDGLTSFFKAGGRLK